MPTPTYEDDYRNEIADTLAGKPFGEAQTPFGKAMASLPRGIQNAPTQMPSGMPQTPTGGVPGSGLAPAGPSTVQLPPQAGGGMRAPMQMTPPAPQLGGLGQPLGMPQGMPQQLPPVSMDMPQGVPYGLSQAPGLADAAAPRPMGGRGKGRRRAY